MNGVHVEAIRGTAKEVLRAQRRLPSDRLWMVGRHFLKHFGNSKVAGGSRRETRFCQGWLGVGFFKHSRGNCGLFREAL